MPQVVVIADDLTGANATGCQLRKHQLRVLTLLKGKKSFESLDANIQQYDGITYSTNSRGIYPQDAYYRIYQGVRMLKSPNVVIYAKRIDSTMRGNIGKETEAFLDALDNEAIALVVPCFPDAGRTCENGRLLVDGVPLHQTVAAADPKNPVDTDEVGAILGKQTDYPFALVTRADLSKGEEALVQTIKQRQKEGIRLLIFDATCQEDLDLIAKGAIATKENVVAVDPGVFTATLSAHRLSKSKMEPASIIGFPKEDFSKNGWSSKKASKVLIVIGSVNKVATEQYLRFLEKRTCHHVLINIKELLESDTARITEIERVVSEILGNSIENNKENSKVSDGKESNGKESSGEVSCEKASKDEKVEGKTNLASAIVLSSIYPENRIDFESYLRSGQTTEDISSMINQTVASIVHNILKDDSAFGSLYTSGGDISAAVCARLDATGILLDREIVPLASYGELIGGDFDGIRCITKGGMVGDKDALVKCIDFLLRKA